MLVLSVFLYSDTPNVLARKKMPKYKLVFHDEFNSKDGKLDTTMWSRAPRAENMWAKWNSNSPEVIRIKKGKLICRAIPNPSLSDTATMFTGAINTKNKFYVKYGRIEVRMKTNGKRGNFPAAWMRPQIDGNPYLYGEIDIIEYFGNEGIARQTIHSHRSTMMNKKDQQTTFLHKDIDCTKWHVYAIEWTPTAIATFIDGVQTGCYPKSSDKVKLTEGQWSFDRPFYLILNQSLGYGNWHAPNTDDTYETYFDWVRVYKKE